MKVSRISGIIGLILAVVLCAGCTDAPATNADKPEASQAGGQSVMPSPVRSFIASNLAKMYDEDNDGAKEYEGKVISVTGKFKEYNEVNGVGIEKEYDMGFIYCKMSPDDPTDIASLGLKEGDKIRIIGTLDKEFGNIRMKDCWYVPNLGATVDSDDSGSAAED